MNLHQGDSLVILKTLPDNSIDSLVTDPPAGISFMSKEWDDDKGGRDAWIEWMSEIMSECLRVLKPGAHGLVWSIPRTSHWTGLALEKAGFEVRDVISHLFGQGFPKSLDISKAIDKAAGAEREVIGEKHCGLHHRSWVYNFTDDQWKAENRNGDFVPVTVPSTEAAKHWDGWGTALKPAVEMWWLVRKPCSEKTVASNVLKWGTGGINIDGCRVEAKDQAVFQNNWNRKAKAGFGNGLLQGGIIKEGYEQYKPKGRFPANLVLSHSEYCTDQMCDIECAVALLNAQSGPCKTGNLEPYHNLKASKNKSMSGGNQEGRVRQSFGGDSASGASRFFYCAKINPSERNAGLENSMKTKKMSEARLNSPHLSGKFPDHDAREKKGNFHPTVKPQKLMRYLCKLVTPPQGIVLDPFMGSGSTGLAALSEGFNFIGIEKEQEYFEIAEARIKANERA